MREGEREEREKREDRRERRDTETGRTEIETERRKRGNRER